METQRIMDEWTIVGGVLVLCLLWVACVYMPPYETPVVTHEDHDASTNEFLYKPVTLGVYSIAKNTYIQTYQRYVRHVDNVPDMEHLSEVADTLLDRFDVLRANSLFSAGDGYIATHVFQTETDTCELRLLSAQ